MQGDGDTIITKKEGYEISLKEIYSGVLSKSGSYSAKVEQIEMLEKRVAELEKENTSLKGTPRGRIDLGTEKSINVKEILIGKGYDEEIYKNLKKENFAVEVKPTFSGGYIELYSAYADEWKYAEDTGAVNGNYYYSYNDSTGIFNVNVINTTWTMYANCGITQNIRGGSVKYETHTYLFL